MLNPQDSDVSTMVIKMHNPEPTREQVNALAGATMLEFGASWCGYCQAAQAAITAELSRFPHVRHIQIEDGKGRRLGRMFHVKQWPTLIFMQDGVEVARMVREIQIPELRSALLTLNAQS